MQAAALADVVEQELVGDATAVCVHASPRAAWATTLHTTEGRDERAATIRRRVLEILPPPSAYVLARREGRPAAVGRAVLARGWLGIFSMATLPAYRRTGAARAVLSALAAWGAERGATQAYLQVVEGNGPAFPLYARHGCTTLYRDHYREA